MRTADDPIERELFGHRFAALAEEMGRLLTRSAFSPNIKERRDHSCALFDGSGQMVAQAAHIPVHLGSAPRCVQAIIETLALEEGQTAIVNDPFAGGTHLPDITLVSPVFLPGDERPSLYVANRAHHADVGGISPGSLPLARTIDEEGWRVAPTLLTDEIVDDLLATTRTPDERRGDLYAQRAANALGVRRALELVDEFGADTVRAQAAALLDHAERLTRSRIADWPKRSVSVRDVLDSGAVGADEPVEIALTLHHDDGTLRLDFGDSAAQVDGPMNAVRAITESAVFYCLLCVAGDDVPRNSGAFRVASVETRPGTIVDARPPAAVSAGNVETSQRIVDVVFQAMRELIPERIGACASGTMSNILIGSRQGADRPYVYYETICGGYGATPDADGTSAVQVHMTNTRNTPVEALEHAYPLRLDRYAVRHGSGGAGKRRGGHGVIRTYRFREAATVTLIGERRHRGAPGAMGGSPGAPGEHVLVSASGERRRLDGKITLEVEAGDVVEVHTPGGGGWGEPSGAD